MNSMLRWPSHITASFEVSHVQKIWSQNRILPIYYGNGADCFQEHLNDERLSNRRKSGAFPWLGQYGGTKRILPDTHILPQLGQLIVATFLSPLHRVHTSWLLADSLDLPDTLRIISLDDFVTRVVERFSIGALSLREIYVPAAAIIALGEAHWQNEFYRAALSLSPGIVLWPEYDTTQTCRINFFVPARKWGIELLRDGSWIQ
jgi:hypothetical protein